MAVPPFLTKIFSTGATELIKGVGSVVDDLITSKEEREQLKQALIQEVNRHEEKLVEMANSAAEAELKDTQNARDSNVKIQESDKASWLSKNLAYCIDAFFVVAFVVMLFVIFYKQVPDSNKEIFYTSFGLLGGYVGTIMNFHRGTSTGSKASGDALRQLMTKNKNQ